MMIYSHMLKKLPLAFVFSLLIWCNLHAINTVTPPELEEFSSVAAYSVIRDSRGAIWLNTSKGLFRYNGHSLQLLRAQIPWKDMAAGENFVFAQTQDGIRKYDIITLEDESITLDGIEVQVDDLTADGDTLYAASANKLYVCTESRLELFSGLPQETTVTCLDILPDHRIVASTNGSGFFVVNPAIKSVDHFMDGCNITATYLCDDDKMWISNQDYDMILLDTSSWETIRTISFREEQLTQSIRAITQGDNGDMFAGTAQGLYRVDPDGKIHVEKVGKLSHCPVCCLLHDEDDNIWIGTYYGGMQLACPKAFPYEELSEDGSILTVKGISEEKDGLVYIFTDGNGIWQYDTHSGRKFLVPGSTGIKFQNSYLDPGTGLIWSGEYHGGICSFSPSTFALKRYDFISDEIQTAHSIFRNGDNLLVGCESGLFSFNPSVETAISRSVSGTDSYIYDICPGPDGKILIAGLGLFTMDTDSTVVSYEFTDKKYAWVNQASCYDIDFDNDGRLWMAFARRGVVMIDGDKIKHLTKENYGLPDNFTFNVIPRNDGTVLVGTASGMAVINDAGDSPCFNYSSIIGRHITELSDETILAGDNNGVKSLGKFVPYDKTCNHSIDIDQLYANGIPSISHTLNHTQRNISFDVSSFDYTGTVATSYYCRLEGFEKGWKRFDINTPVAYMNMKPRKYRFEVEMRTFSGDVLSSDSMDIRIKPAWYATALAKILFAILILGTAGFIFYSRYSRKKLTEELTRKEREDKERTAFFVDLSYQLRTPLNLIIGNLERFFHDFGNRTAGIEKIEDIYAKAKQMRSMISQYVDTQTEAVEQESDTPEAHDAVKDTKFVNSAIGAVERNLYAPDLNVPLLCKEMNLGKTALCNKIRATTGMSPREFIEDIKLKTAAQMLLDGNLKVAEISDLLNFSTPKYFSQRFVLKFGVKPKEYAALQGPKS